MSSNKQIAQLQDCCGTRQSAIKPCKTNNNINEYKIINFFYKLLVIYT